MAIDNKNELAFAFKAIKILSTDFNKLDAFKDGIIDKEGNRIVPHWSSLDQKKYRSYNIFIRLILLIKQLTKKLPANLKMKLDYHNILKALREEVESISTKEDSIEFIYELNDTLQRNFSEEEHEFITRHVVDVVMNPQPISETTEHIADCAELELFELYESMSVGGGVQGGSASLAGVSDVQVDPAKNTIVKKKKKKKKKKKPDIDEKTRKIIDKL